MIPEKIGRYEVQSELGRGGMATVFKAYDPVFERTVALKVLPAQMTHDPEFRARFEREAKTIAALEHPAIVPVYDFGEGNGQPYLVMRYMPGGSLADRLQEGEAIPINEAARIMRRLASALDRAHQQGIVHRDLKPGNILFDQYGDAYLADFGIVRLTTSSAALTASGGVVGTPTYMSPEQVYGDKELDGRSDIYALGVILFQMLTGHLPYDAPTPAKMMMKHVMDPVPRILDTAPDLPLECEHVIEKAMAKDRDERFGSAGELAETLISITRKHERPDFAAMQEAAQEQAPPPPEPEPEPASLKQTPPTPAAPLPTPPQVTAPPEAADPLPAPGSLTDRAPAKKEKGTPGWVWGMIGGLLLLCGVTAVTALALLAWSGSAENAAATGTAQSIFAAATETAVSAEAATVAAQAVVIIAEREETETPAPELAASETPDALDADATATADAAVAARATLEAEATLEARALAQRATATAEAAAVPENSGVDFGEPLFGPLTGELPHQLDNLVESEFAEVDVADFIAQAEIITPYDADENGWDFGFMFRQGAANDEWRLVVSSDGYWSLNNRLEGDDDFIIEGDVAEILETDEGDANLLTLIAVGEQGYFFLNDELVSALDLSQRTTGGDVALSTGFYTENEVEGATTAYQNFVIWLLNPAAGPLSGELEHAADGLVKGVSTDVDLLNFITTAVFINPYSADEGSFDIGFTFRRVESGNQMWQIVTSSGGWDLVNRIDNEDEFLEDGEVENLNLEADGRNRLTFIALDETGYFLVNEELTAVLDLEDRMDAGDVWAVTAFYGGNEIEGEATGYDAFTVWPMPE